MKKQIFRRVCRNCKDDFEVEGRQLMDYIVIPPQDFLCDDCAEKLGYKPPTIEWLYENSKGTSGVRVYENYHTPYSKIED